MRFLLLLHVCRAIPKKKIRLRALLEASFVLLRDLATSEPKSRRIRDLASHSNNVATSVKEPVWKLLAEYCQAELAVAERSSGLRK
jgi:hypothetical protein